VTLRSPSFRTRLTVRWTLAFGTLLALANLGIWAGVAGFVRSDLDAQLRTLAATELASAVDEYRGVHIHDFPAGALAGGEYADKLAQLLAADGRVLAALPPSLRSIPLLSPQDARAVTAGETPLGTHRVLGRPIRWTALRTEKDGIPYVLCVGLFTDRLDDSLRRLAVLLAAVWAAGLVATAAVGFVLASRALAPVDRITRRATEIAEGDFSARLDPPATDDEIGRMTRLLNEMIERLHEAVEANRRFAADASHEIRSPLTVMQGEIDVALKRERGAGEYREALENVREQALEMRRLTDDLLVLVRAQEGRLEIRRTEVALAPLLAECVARARPLAGPRGVSLQAEGLPELVAYADARLLTRVLSNLIQNAIQYNRPGGSVRFHGRSAPAAGAGWTTGHVILEVEDTGHGIAPEERERVFERFYRADPSRSRRTGGTGLGLPLCREILKVLGGQIRISASTAEGTTLEVRLPGRDGTSGA